jgi:hypothetical protein
MRNASLGDFVVVRTYTYTNLDSVAQCFLTFVRPRPGKFFFYKTRARFQQIIGLQAIFMTGHKQRYSLSRMLKDLDVWKFPITHEYLHV